MQFATAEMDKFVIFWCEIVLFLTDTKFLYELFKKL